MARDRGLKTRTGLVPKKQKKNEDRTQAEALSFIRTGNPTDIHNVW